MAPKNPRRVARNAARQYGGRVHANDRHGTNYIFDDGYVWFIHDSEPWHVIREKIRTLRERYGTARGDNYHWMENRPGKPNIDFDRLVASDHAKERLQLMQAQAKVEFREVLYCLRTPERVLWSDQHESWLWLNGRIGVAVKETAGRFIITTILWATGELFDAHPRPLETHR